MCKQLKRPHQQEKRGEREGRGEKALHRVGPVGTRAIFEHIGSNLTRVSMAVSHSRHVLDHDRRSHNMKPSGMPNKVTDLAVSKIN